MSGPTTPAPAPPKLEELVLREQVASVFATIRGATFADGAVAMVFGGIMYWRLREPLILLWMALHMAQNLRLPLLTAYFRDPDAASRSPFWARLYSREVLINSCVWGLAPLMFLPAGNLPLTSLMMLVMMGICATGALSVASLKQALFCYVVPMMVGLTAALALNADAISLFLAACCAGFLVMTLKFATQQHRLLTEARWSPVSRRRPWPTSSACKWPPRSASAKKRRASWQPPATTCASRCMRSPCSAPCSQRSCRARPPSATHRT